VLCCSIRNLGSKYEGIPLVRGITGYSEASRYPLANVELRRHLDIQISRRLSEKSYQSSLFRESHYPFFYAVVDRLSVNPQRWLLHRFVEFPLPTPLTPRSTSRPLRPECGLFYRNLGKSPMLTCSLS